MQYSEELAAAVNCVYTEMENRRNNILNQIQLHAVNQIKDGYTSFRVNRLKTADERYLKEWANMTNANVKEIKFRCFENDKRYIIKQFMVDLTGSIKLDYELEGKSLIIEE